MRRVFLLGLGLIASLTVEGTEADCGKGLDIDGHLCVDIDECREDKEICGPNSSCINSPGYYNCMCNPGFTLHATQCVPKDIDECESQETCGEHAACHNTVGSFYCTCHPGYTLESGRSNFTDDGPCKRLIASLTVEATEPDCGKGFNIDGHLCVDDDECQYDNPICGEHAVCYNTHGSYYCQCKPGYQTHSLTVNFTKDKCGDINECREDKEICGPNSSCINSHGSYTCTCNPGFTLHATQCVPKDIDECESQETCGEHAACHNTMGSFYCTCHPGYTLESGRSNFTDDGPCKQLLCPASLNEGSSIQVPVKLEKTLAKLRSMCLEQSKTGPIRDGSMEPMHEELSEMLLDVVDTLLSAGPLNNSRKVTALLGITEHALRLIGPMLQKSPITTASDHTDLEILVRRGKDAPRGPIILSTSGTQLESDWTTVAGDPYLGFATVSLLSYKNLHKLVNNYFYQIETQVAGNLSINSRVVTAVVTNLQTANLEKPITLTFPLLEEASVGNQICVFWDATLGHGAWSTSGCTVVGSSKNHTVCSCTHLSSFAVLMALYEQEDMFELQLITWVGLSLSLVCLFISILTFGFIRSIQSTRTTIHLHLCISLFAADLIFLIGITQTENQVGCAFVAGLLHFFFLAAFCWMCLEGVQLFRMVVLVFNTTLKPVYLMAAGYGVPALIVAISAAINAKGYGTRRHCWLNLEDGFIWSFFGPVCFIIVVNAFFFLITVWKLAEKFSSLSQDLSNLHKVKTFTITAVAQLCVLGTMWIFGCFQFDNGSLAMSFLFTILNSLQGVLVFTMHCLLCRQVRDEYIKILTRICASKKSKYSEFSTNQSSKSQATGSVQHTGESHI
ncbi:adhesion G protein-coupled receptor E5 isoform X2 [Brachyhypopomus gauderio]|uniref:adhesion G protein-coupled receptor E5 isoform X2 n=1 Tax=Brachyhypopomus gauderio TaxID=698409 RepID=UPI0040422371